MHESVTAFVYADMWILLYVLIPSFLGVCGLFSCVFDRPKISFLSHDMCCISREFIVVFLCIYCVRCIWFIAISCLTHLYVVALPSFSL